MRMKQFFAEFNIFLFGVCEIILRSALKGRRAAFCSSLVLALVILFLYSRECISVYRVCMSYLPKPTPKLLKKCIVCPQYRKTVLSFIRIGHLVSVRLLSVRRGETDWYFRFFWEGA